MSKKDLSIKIIEDDLMKNTRSFFLVFNEIGLWDPIKLKGEFYIHKNTPINEKFKEFMVCL